VVEKLNLKALMALIDLSTPTFARFAAENAVENAKIALPSLSGQRLGHLRWPEGIRDRFPPGLNGERDA
jgi:hypothetical protein